MVMMMMMVFAIHYFWQRQRFNS